MYEEYYGFIQPPFSLTPDPRFLYRSESHDVALQQVWQAIRRKEGFIVLTGDIGTGKTTLCRTLLEQFDQTTFTALILNPFLSVEELLREVLLSYGVVSKDALKTGRLATASKHELVRTLHDFLLSLVPLHGSAVLIIDEAQHLTTDVLEEIRILSNLETNDQKLLQIVIVGQLNLLEVLAKNELRQLDQRISIRCSLKALTREEVEAYVTHRLWVARGSTSVSFTPKAFDLVHAVSGGVPRMINLLCDRALMVGCEAQTSRIAEEHIVKAAGQVGHEIPKGKVRGERAGRGLALIAPARRDPRPGGGARGSGGGVLFPRQSDGAHHPGRSAGGEGPAGRRPSLPRRGVGGARRGAGDRAATGDARFVLRSRRHLRDRQPGRPGGTGPSRAALAGLHDRHPAGDRRHPPPGAGRAVCDPRRSRRREAETRARDERCARDSGRDGTTAARPLARYRSRDL